MRAPTPTAAAELAVPHIDEIIERLLNSKARLAQSMRDNCKREKQRLKHPTILYFALSSRIYEQKMEQLDQLTERLHQVRCSSLHEKMKTSLC